MINRHIVAMALVLAVEAAITIPAWPIMLQLGGGALGVALNCAIVIHWVWCSGQGRDYERKYARACLMSVRQLRKSRVLMRCACKFPDCEGFAMVPKSRVHDKTYRQMYHVRPL